MAQENKKRTLNGNFRQAILIAEVNCFQCNPGKKGIYFFCPNGAIFFSFKTTYRVSSMPRARRCKLVPENTLRWHKSGISTKKNYGNFLPIFHRLSTVNQ